MRNNILDILQRTSTSTDAFELFDKEHPLDIYLGADEDRRPCMGIVMDADCNAIPSSKLIDVKLYRRKDNRRILKFSLREPTLLEIFSKFCEDVIENTRTSTKEEGFAPIIDRWMTWINFFSKALLPLSENQIIGLIGELMTFDKLLASEYGYDAALQAYIGTKKTHKDFSIADTWYESKAIHFGKTTVEISSIEQLDSNVVGHLSVWVLDNSTSQTKGSITINSVVNDIMSRLNRAQQHLLEDKLRESGYIQDEIYDQFAFIVIDNFIYTISDDFPRIKKDLLPTGITKAHYEIDLSSIEAYKEV